MELRHLGNTGIKVSPLGLGTVKLGRNQQVKYPHGFTLPDDKTVRELLALTWDLGINLIDTAPAYGNSEERLGALLPHPNDWIITTKVGESFVNGQSSFDFSATGTRNSVEHSLKRLDRSYVDIVLVHSDGNDMHIIQQEEALGTLADMKKEGLVRAYGMSTKTEEGGLWVVQHCDVVMATCNPTDTHDEIVIEAARKQNKGVLVKKGLQSGHADTSAGGSGIEAAFHFIFSHVGVSSVIVGTIDPDHLRQNVVITQKVLRME